MSIRRSLPPKPTPWPSSDRQLLSSRRRLGTRYRTIYVFFTVANKKMSRSPTPLADPSFYAVKILTEAIRMFRHIQHRHGLVSWSDNGSDDYVRRKKGKISSCTERTKNWNTQLDDPIHDLSHYPVEICSRACGKSVNRTKTGVAKMRLNAVKWGVDNVEVEKYIYAKNVRQTYLYLFNYIHDYIVFKIFADSTLSV